MTSEMGGAAASVDLEVTAFDGPDAEWDAFVERTNATFCHLAPWRRIVGDVLGHDCLYAVARDASGAWEGVLPLVRVKSRVFGHFLISMPFLNYGGPAGAPGAQELLAAWAAGEARTSGADLLELRSRTEFRSDLQLSHRKITVVLDLPGTASALWDAFPAKLRSQIRRPQKEGMEVRFGANEVLPFYEVYARNMRDLGTPVLARAFFERLPAAFGDRVTFAVVYHRERPVAAGCGFEWRGEFEITWASSLRELNKLAPNMLLYWALIERMIARGIRAFNFGRCTPDGGTHRFKRQWGGVDVPLPWRTWSARAEAAPPSPDRPIYQLAGRVWSRLPVGLANRIGPPLARLLP